MLNQEIRSTGASGYLTITLVVTNPLRDHKFLPTHVPYCCWTRRSVLIPTMIKQGAILVLAAPDRTARRRAPLHGEIPRGCRRTYRRRQPTSAS